MSTTLTPGDAVRIVATRYPKLDASGVAARFCDEVQAMIWHRWPWRQSIAELPPVAMLLEEPDYGPPTLAVPNDFYGLYRANLRNSSQQVVPLVVVPELAISTGTGIPSSVAYQPEKRSFRFHPRPSITSPEWWMEGSYKKTPTKITNANLNSYILPFDDLYFEVYRRGLIWKVKDEILGDPGAKEDLALFLMLIDKMAAAEGLQAGVVVVAPAEGLELGG